MKNQISTEGMNLNLELGEFSLEFCINLEFGIFNLEYLLSSTFSIIYDPFWTWVLFFLKSILDLFPYSKDSTILLD